MAASVDLKTQAQQMLVARGYHLGTTGPNRDGVDGEPGALTWTAIVAALSERPAASPAPAPAGAAPVAGVIGMIDAALLAIACPGRAAQDLQIWVEPIKKACGRFEMNAVRRVAAFIAQMSVESSGFSRLEEGLSYSAQRMAEVWPHRYAINPDQRPVVPNALAFSLAHQPEAFANAVYANRMGNGPPESGDGYRFRGQGPLQVTGRENWTLFAGEMQMSLDDAMAYATTPEGGIMSAAWFWEHNDVNRLADTPGVSDESRKINGGDNGLADRTTRFNAVVRALLERGA